MQVFVSAHFNKQTKDSKKELLQFHVTGEDEKQQELDSLCREVVELEIDGVDLTLTAEFSKKTKDAKKTILEFIVKGDTSAEQSFQFYKHSGSDVDLTITKSNMSKEEFRGPDEPRRGKTVKVNPDGTADVEDDGKQMTIEELQEQEGSGGDGTGEKGGKVGVTDDDELPI